ncbi:Holliday junction branch migration protein RuvA [Deinococcus peraridilitoris]|uniref:Holliday junction branch migration complex subunit RuvA n=1 Tax=Deinococcus peraridilitoris (strain DSM 19664 / LMG 22246 / CIP 109416 / KR-200) TaxID=937777 RepID=L0A5B1_DEIPD|nr:Holliday junction branch migration protein RuvA [Deinococcus peraridilitoris]AFZ68604.1 Holliday junction DNA helicase, RuvA subunit [Deinococcus peraridilitoris DSM 19664]
MIAFLEGPVRELRENSAVVMAGGVGYEVLCPRTTLDTLQVETVAQLHTRLQIREDAWTLFGFHHPDLATLFDYVTGVSGVGGKLALALLSAMPSAVLAHAILQGDIGLLSSVSGVGKKTAERLSLELRNKLPPRLANEVAQGVRRPAGITNSAERDAVDALLALGYRELQVRAAVSELVAENSELSADQIIRKSLGRLR